MSDKKKNNIEKKSNHNLSDDRKLRSEGGDDTQLDKREKPVDFTGNDLDIPGRTLPKDQTKKQLKDEENQLYSESDNDL